MIRRGRRCRPAGRRGRPRWRTPPRRCLVRTGPQDLDVDQSGDEEQHGDQEHHADEPHPAGEGPALPAPPLARQRDPGGLGRRAVRALPWSCRARPRRRRGAEGRRADGARAVWGGPAGWRRMRRVPMDTGRAAPLRPGRRLLGGALTARTSARAVRPLSGRDAHGVDVGVVVAVDEDEGDDEEVVPALAPDGAPAPAGEVSAGLARVRASPSGWGGARTVRRRAAL